MFSQNKKDTQDKMIEMKKNSISKENNNCIKDTTDRLDLLKIGD